MKIRLFISVLSLFLFPQVPFAEGRPDVSGSIDLEVEQKKGASLAEIREGAVQFISLVENEMVNLAEGKVVDLPTAPTSEVIRYIAASYLHCSVQRGTCPELLITVLEYDIIKSRFQKNAACPTMLRFWESWIKDDMEKRHQYLTKTGYFSVTTEFKKSVRPRFVKCVPTVTEAIAGDNLDTNFFKKRYSGDTSLIKSATTARLLMNEIAAKTPDIFSVVGLKK